MAEPWKYYNVAHLVNCIQNNRIKIPFKTLFSQFWCIFIHSLVDAATGIFITMTISYVEESVILRIIKSKYLVIIHLNLGQLKKGNFGFLANTAVEIITAGEKAIFLT